ncbi:MAG: DEAD/DEAH box helicase [Thermofilaceae archaeon]|nr:DEAD/DEAH box helicase [Thermofilaceae archaeon]
MQEARKILFKVKVGDTILSSEKTWDEVQQLKNLVKVFCRWDSQEKAWLTSVEKVLKNYEKAQLALKEAFGDKGLKLLDEITAEDRALRVEEARKGRLLMLPSSSYSLGFQLLQRHAKSYTRSIKNTSVKYVLLDLESAIEEVLEWGVELNKAADALLELLYPLDPMLTPEQANLIRDFSSKLTFPEYQFVVKIKEFGDSGALAIFPRPLSEKDISEITRAFTVEYYRQQLVEKSVELVPERLTLAKIIARRAVKIPFTLVPVLENLIERMGFSHTSEINWPQSSALMDIPSPKLYSFQEDALKAWRNAACRGTVIMPTGAGKSFVALAAIAELKVPTLICVTTVELAKQWVKRVEEHLGVKAGILAGGEKTVKPITVATYHSAFRSLPSIYDSFCFLICDEGHHLPAETFKNIALKVKSRYTMVLSATPKRSDMNEALIYKVCGEPVYTISYYNLVLKGLLAPLALEKIPVDLSGDEIDMYVKLSASHENRYLRETSDLIKLASKAKAKLDVLKDIVKKEEGRILVFCQYLDQAHEAYVAVRSVEQRSALITGSTPKGERLRSFEAFRRGDIRVIVTTTVLDEGVDVPDADVAVILSGSGQVRQMVQRVGRVLRWMPGKIAKVYEIVARGTIEEAISRSRSLFKLLDQREVKASLEIALSVFSKMKDFINDYEKSSILDKQKWIDEARSVFVKLAFNEASKHELKLS